MMEVFIDETRLSIETRLRRSEVNIARESSAISDRCWLRCRPTDAEYIDDDVRPGDGSMNQRQAQWIIGARETPLPGLCGADIRVWLVARVTPTGRGKDRQQISEHEAKAAGKESLIG